MISLVWFRIDLRLADNPALRAALDNGGTVIPVFIFAPEEEEPWEPGGASRWWLHQSLREMDGQLRTTGSRLILRAEPSLAALRALINDTGAEAVYWNRRYEPAMIARDAKIKEALQGNGCKIESFNAALLHEPWTIQNKSRKPFQVFTPFWKHCLDMGEPADPTPAPKRLPAPKKWPKSLALDELKLESKIDWVRGMRETWRPGEAGARECLKTFLTNGLEDYSRQRNHPGVVGTSRLSPHLHFGEISTHQIWRALQQTACRKKWSEAKWRNSQFVAELGWREFSHHLLYHFPQTPTQPLRAEFQKLAWREDPAWLKAWQKGRTGYPIVDAGMRELWTIGWMHNRVRMIVASFLVKDLLLDWQSGARWFWDTLVDADLAQNTLGWQWTAGCGADAAPYFRVFNPTTQGEKFDPEGEYVKRWCPELGGLSRRWIHRPAEAPDDVLAAAGIVLGRSYPAPIINHSIAREVALEAFAQLKRARD